MVSELKNAQTNTIEKASEVSVTDVGSFDDEARAVPSKYRGTAKDKRDMFVLGKKQVPRVSRRDTEWARLILSQRNFRFMTMLGFASTAMASWEVLLP